MSFCARASHGSWHAWREVKMVKCLHCGKIEEKCPKLPGPHVWKKTEEDCTERFDWGCIPGQYCIHCGERE